MSERWAVIGDDPANLHVVQADALHLRVCFLTSNGPTEERANLIASAPDLLSVAKRWAVLDAGGWRPDRCAADKAQLIVDTLAAIAKAEGKQP